MSDPAKLDLQDRDELVFHGDGDPLTSTVTRRRKMMPETLWGNNIQFASDTAIGTHRASGKTFTINFFTGGHSGSIDFGKGVLATGTWMADEG